MRMLRLRTIVAATDLSESSDVALDAAAQLAAAAGAALHVVFVSANSQQGKAEVRRALERTGAAPRDLSIHVVPGDPRTTIGPLAEALHADVIVLGRHRVSNTRDDDPPVGSTAYAVIISAGIPCLVISRPLALPISRALVAMDKSKTSRGALIVAISWASALRDRAHPGTYLTAVHVNTGREAPSVSMTIEDELTALRRVSGDWAGVSVSATTLEAPDPVAAIARFADELSPDLVVLGTRAIGRPTHPVLGSVAAAVTNRLAMPVLLVPPAVWREYSGDIEIQESTQGTTDAESAVR